ncbi:CorA family divalent cation transporter, partial [Micrococcus lylae]|uniref:CorA family divalent cation transporter n=2 Tax=Micrococcaceae TaxID=1268 RepID=UPI001FD7EBA4
MTIIDNAVYKNGRRILAPTSLDQTWRALKESGDLAWLGMYRPDAHELQEVADELHLHELAVEDALSGGQRAKLEHYGEDWFMVLHPARYIDETETVEFGEIGVFSGDDYVVTVRHAEEPDLAAVRHSLERDSPDRLALGPWQVTFEILDKVVDDYFPVADGLEQDIGEIEDQIFAGDAHVSRRIYELSREVLNFQHAIRALPTMVDQLQDDARARLHADEAGESSAASQGAAIEVENLRRLRDVHDHAVQINERVAAMRAMLNSALELDS